MCHRQIVPCCVLRNKWTQEIILYNPIPLDRQQLRSTVPLYPTPYPLLSSQWCQNQACYQNFNLSISAMLRTHSPTPFVDFFIHSGTSVDLSSVDVLRLRWFLRGSAFPHCSGEGRWSGEVWVEVDSPVSSRVGRVVSFCFLYVFIFAFCISFFPLCIFFCQHFPCICFCFL